MAVDTPTDVAWACAAMQGVVKIMAIPWLRHLTFIPVSPPQAQQFAAMMYTEEWKCFSDAKVFRVEA